MVFWQTALQSVGRGEERRPTDGGDICDVIAENGCCREENVRTNGGACRRWPARNTLLSILQFIRRASRPFRDPLNQYKFTLGLDPFF